LERKLSIRVKSVKASTLRIFRATQHLQR